MGFLVKKYTTNILKGGNYIVVGIILISVFATVLKIYFQPIELANSAGSNRPSSWSIDWDSDSVPSCDSGFTLEEYGHYTGTQDYELWTFKATENGTGKVIGWDNDPYDDEIGHRVFHFPEGADTTYIANADWVGIPPTTPKSDDEHPYWSNQFEVVAGDIYQMRAGEDSIWAGFCFKSGSAVSCAGTCEAELVSFWTECNYCDPATHTTAECLAKELECRQKGVDQLSLDPANYPAPINDTSTEGRILWFNWGYTNLACGTACGMGLVCCTPPITPADNDAWWQTSAGNVYIKSNLASDIPDECVTPDCDANLITKNIDGNINSAGVPMTHDNHISVNGRYTDRSPESRAFGVDHSNMVVENYTHFIRDIDIATATPISSTIYRLPFGALQDSDNTEMYFRNSSLNVDFNSTQTVPSGTKMIIFVNGDLNIDSSVQNIEYIEVEEGGYLAFIVKGDINISPNIGNDDATDTTANLQGVYVADQAIRIKGYSWDNSIRDKKFVGEGTFVGWNEFSVARDYTNTTEPADRQLNNENPVEVFIFRPDLHKNTPAVMKRPNQLWQEVN